MSKKKALRPTGWRAIYQYGPKPPITYASSDAFLQSREWKQLRMDALELYGGKCQCCGASAKDGAKLNVDHIKPRRFYPKLCLTLSNLQVLCADCNEGKGSVYSTDWRNQ